MVAGQNASVGEVQYTLGLENGVLLRGSPGDTHLVIDLAAAATPHQATRPAMGVALVIDRSGSMSGPKMANAITAATSFIENMADGDVVALYQYDDIVEQLAPPTTLSSASRPSLLAALSAMHARGSTNLHGGLVAGIAGLSSAAAERPVRRVILISDGLANVGPSSPAELGRVAAGAAARGISVTAIGVGLDYDENVLGSLAVRSGGRFYHLQEPAQMAAILTSELNALSQTVARNVIIELAPAPGVQIRSATGADLLRRNGRYLLRVGELLGGASRPVVVSMRVPTHHGEEHRAATVALRYQSAVSGADRSDSSTVFYHLSGSAEEADESINPQFALAVESHRAAVANQEAARLLNQGDSESAANRLQAQAQRLDQRARRLPTAERQQLEQQAQRLRRRSSSVRRARRPAARRAASLQMSDDALQGLGF